MKNICSSLVTGNLEQKNNNNNFSFLITHFVFPFPFPIPAFSNIGVCHFQNGGLCREKVVLVSYSVLP